MAKRSDTEIRAELAAKIAKIDEREANRKAREASKDVRRMEADIRVLARLMETGNPSVDTLKETHDELVSLLKMARAAAVKP